MNFCCHIALESTCSKLLLKWANILSLVYMMQTKPYIIFEIGLVTNNEFG